METRWRKAIGNALEKIFKTKPNKKTKNTLDDKESGNYIARNILENENDSALKLIQSAPNENGPFVDEPDDRYIIFDQKKIYLITNGKIEVVLHQVKKYEDGEYVVTKTKEGYTLSEFGSITINKPDGEKETYETEAVPVSEVYVEDQYIR